MHTIVKLLIISGILGGLLLAGVGWAEVQYPTMRRLPTMQEVEGVKVEIPGNFPWLFQTGSTIVNISVCCGVFWWRFGKIETMITVIYDGLKEKVTREECKARCGIK